MAPKLQVAQKVPRIVNGPRMVVNGRRKKFGTKTDNLKYMSKNFIKKLVWMSGSPRLSKDVYDKVRELIFKFAEATLQKAAIITEGKKNSNGRHQKTVTTKEIKLALQFLLDKKRPIYGFNDK